MANRATRVGVPRGGWLLAGVLAVALASSSSLAPSAAAPAGRGLMPLPEAFAKPLPSTLDDLRAIEDHVVPLVRQVRTATVGVRVGRAFGSGVIVSSDGLMLTAGHVSGRPGQSAEVTLSDGRTVSAMTLGQNVTADSGMMRLMGDRDDWPFAEISPDEAAGKGDWCLVMGHPGGTKPDRPAVVRLGRVLFNGDNLLQTDCELVGGDSGGPLFDMHGRVIAINSRIAESADMNFHVPVSSFREDWDRLLAGETFSEEDVETSKSMDSDGHSGALLGVSGERNYGAPGVRITEVDADGAADFAGMRVGDVILTFQDEPVNDFRELVAAVGRERPGTRVRIEVRRRGTRMILRARLGSRLPN